MNFIYRSLRLPSCGSIWQSSLLFFPERPLRHRGRHLADLMRLVQRPTHAPPAVDFRCHHGALPCYALPL